MLRTHTAGELREANIGETITLAGWVDRIRDLGQLFFVNLRDRYGVTQCVFEDSNPDNPMFPKLKSLANEFCIQVTGDIRKRLDKDVNHELPTGAIELVIQSITILNTSEVLPHSSDALKTMLMFPSQSSDGRVYVAETGTVPLQLSIATADFIQLSIANES